MLIAEPTFPTLEKSIGRTIRTPQAEGVIHGVRIEPVALWPDDRGYFLEVARLGTGLVAEFTAATTQVSAALSYAGTIKAFHIHERQTDFWVPVTGMFQVALVDLRPDSRTYAVRNTLYCGALKTWQLIIPPGVAHGYKVIGPDSGLLVYLTNRFYDPSDEGRIPHNDPRINYDWETQYK